MLNNFQLKNITKFTINLAHELAGNFTHFSYEDFAKNFNQTPIKASTKMSNKHIIEKTKRRSEKNLFMAFLSLYAFPIILAGFFIVAITFSTTAHAAPDYIKAHVPSAAESGKGRYTYMMFNVYDAALYTPQGTYKQGEPVALSLTYLRSFKGRDIANESIKQMRKIGITDDVKLADWHAQMTRIFPDVKKTDTITGIVTKNSESLFYLNNKNIGKITDKDFTKAFFNIWLSEKTQAPELRAKLLASKEN